MEFTDKQTDRIKLPLIINDNECRADLGINSFIHLFMHSFCCLLRLDLI